MEIFDLANASFTKANDGKWTLDRDWAEFPPTQRELEILFVHTMRLDRVVASFVRHFAAGDLVAAEGLDDAAMVELRAFYAAAIDVLMPPAQTATEGAE